MAGPSFVSEGCIGGAGFFGGSPMFVVDCTVGLLTSVVASMMIGESLMTCDSFEVVSEFSVDFLSSVMTGETFDFSRTTSSLDGVLNVGVD